MKTSWKIGCAGLLIQWLCVAQAMAASGVETAQSLTQLYENTAANCGRSTSPAFLCSGVIFRATSYSRDYKAWSPSPLSLRNGGISFSYLRRDANLTRLVRFEDNGYILEPLLSMAPGKFNYQVLCFFPLDGGSDGRIDNGCGRSVAQPQHSDYCHRQNPRVDTGEKWLEHYRRYVGHDNRRECAFVVSDDLNQYAVINFNAGLEAMRGVPRGDRKQNELRVATWPLDTPDHAVPIKAFFYIVAQGRSDAQADQARYFKESGLWVPVIEMNLPDNVSTAAQFLFRAEDQGITEQGVPIQRYVESADWIDRPDPGFGKNIWTLSVKLTELGYQQSDSLGSDAVYAELVRRYGDDPRWVWSKPYDPTQDGMRRQLVCHFVKARDKTRYNLEPERPYVSHQASLDADCNPVPMAVPKAA